MAAGQSAPVLNPLARIEHNFIERIWISTSHTRTGSPLIGTAPLGLRRWDCAVGTAPLGLRLWDCRVGAGGLEPTTSAA